MDKILQYHERMKTTYSSILKQRHYKQHVLAKNGEYMPVDNSRLKGFYKLSVPERRELLAQLADLTPEQVDAWASSELSEDTADRMIENVVGRYSLPIGVATNFIIDGEHYLIPFVVEEASVVAAASNMAKRCQVKGGSDLTIQTQ